MSHLHQSEINNKKPSSWTEKIAIGVAAIGMVGGIILLLTFGMAFITFIVLLILKSMGSLVWDWIWVFSPFGIVISLTIALAIVSIVGITIHHCYLRIRYWLRKK